MISERDAKVAWHRGFGAGLLTGCVIYLVAIGLGYVLGRAAGAW